MYTLYILSLKSLVFGNEFLAQGLHVKHVIYIAHNRITSEV